ncbi:MAG: hypothetical protein IJR83_06820 [Clostridia bacterium]|nr:hypothetical protein [Clostridia bacterium]
MSSYIRNVHEEKTCYQESGPLDGRIDFGQDMVCVYGVDDGMPERVRQYRERGYAVHLMTGIAWGGYQKFVRGEWDGIDHSDIVQRERSGKVSREFCHEYYCPSIPYVNYLVERMKRAVDAGVEAIHVEEPEYLGESGYEEAFKREFQMYYHKPWEAPHTSVEAQYKCARLGAFLYRRAIDRASAELKDYAMTKYGRELRFYVPTHSLLNYTQWKVLSPEGTLTDLPQLDGYKAQIWMGTTREKNVYKGVYKTRPFETAFLEYGVMQELVRGTGRTMWFDNDPIEDWPTYTWDSYRTDYVRTQIGALLQPHIDRYQICPWPRRIFGKDMKYPQGNPDATTIPADYSTFLTQNFQMLGTFTTDDFEWGRKAPNVGVFLSDSALFQRFNPDDVKEAWKEKDREAAAKYPVLNELSGGSLVEFFTKEALPDFYSLALPPLKGGLPVRPVQLENITRYPQYLDDYDMLILTYEFQKPAGPDVNGVLADFVRRGGKLLYVGDGTDPFHAISSWWNSGDMHDKSPLEHLLRAVGVAEDAKDGIYKFGKGQFGLLRIRPALICLDDGLLDLYKSYVKKMSGDNLDHNTFVLRRGPYTVTAVMDESDATDTVHHKGHFIDMMSTDLAVITEKTVGIGEYSILFDLDSVPKEGVTILGTGIRVRSMEDDAKGVTIKGAGPSFIRVNLRLLLPKKPASCTVSIIPLPETGDPDFPVCKGEALKPEVAISWDESSSSALFTYDSTAGDATIEIKY